MNPAPTPDSRPQPKLGSDGNVPLELESLSCLRNPQGEYGSLAVFALRLRNDALDFENDLLQGVAGIFSSLLDVYEVDLLRLRERIARVAGLGIDIHYVGASLAP